MTNIKCNNCGNTTNFHFNYDYSKKDLPLLDILCNECGEYFSDMERNKVKVDIISTLHIVNTYFINLQNKVKLTSYDEKVWKRVSLLLKSIESKKE